MLSFEKTLPKLKGFLFLVFIGMFLASCSFDGGGSYSLKGGSLKSSSKFIEGSYREFSGTYYRNASLEKGDLLKFNLEIKTQNGTFQVKLENEKGKALTAIEDGTTVVIPSSGVYRIICYAEEHRGSFELKWTENNS